MDKITGIWTALWSPLSEQEKIIEGALKDHLEFLKNAGIEGVVVGGSTGEFPHLTVETRCKLLEAVAKHSRGLKIIVNISDIRWKHVVQLAKCAEQFPVMAAMILPPMYFSYKREDIEAYFLSMSKTTSLPLILYHFPECARNSIDTELVSSLLQQIPLAGIKLSGGDFSLHSLMVPFSQNHRFSVLTGADLRLAEALQIGVDGSIGGISNAFPEDLVAIYHLVKVGKIEEARKRSQKISSLALFLKELNFPLNIAAMMEGRGLTTGVHKAILSPLTLHHYERLVSQFKEKLLEYLN